MTVPVLTAVTDSTWEADLVSALERQDLGVLVVRRCVDVADLLAVAAAGTARAALLSADLRRLDGDALGRLTAARVAVVGLVPPGDEAAERRLRQLGVVHVLAADAGAERISAAVHAAVTAPGADPVGLGAPADPRAALPDLPPGEPGSAAADGPEPEGPGGPDGRVVAVWGPTGAPGRTTLAVGVASELARFGTETLLVDADVYGGVVGQLLGLLDESPGLAAAARLANSGRLDVAALAGHARTVAPHLRVLSGIARAERWTELRPGAVEAVLTLARRLAGVTVVDTGFALEQDEELAYDTTAPRRNGATLATLEAADVVLAVGAADPIGLRRLVRGLGELRALVPDASVQVVVNRVRKGAVPGAAEQEIAAALDRYAGVSSPVFVPYDRAGLDAALAAGRSLGEAAPGSPARLAMAAIAARLVGAQPPRRRRRLLRRRAG